MMASLLQDELDAFIIISSFGIQTKFFGPSLPVLKTAAVLFVSFGETIVAETGLYFGK